MVKVYSNLRLFILRSFWIVTCVAVPTVAWGDLEHDKTGAEVPSKGPTQNPSNTVARGATGSGANFNTVFGDLNASNVGPCIQGFSIPSRKIESIDRKLFSRIVLAFARNVCEEKQPDSKFKVTLIDGKVGQVPCRGEACGDTLEHYAGVISKLDMSKNPLDAKMTNAKITYSILFQLGMIESDGKEQTGKDDTNPAEKDEMTRSAGLFQTSKNSIGFLGQDVYSALLAMHEVRCPGVSGWGYEKQMKDCPDLAVDYMAALARRTHMHNGPIKRGYAQPRQSCMDVLSEVEAKMNAQGGCESIQGMAIANDAGSGYSPSGEHTDNSTGVPPGAGGNPNNPYNIPDSEMYRYKGKDETEDKGLFPNGMPGSDGQTGGSGDGGASGGGGMNMPNSEAGATNTPPATESGIGANSDTGKEFEYTEAPALADAHNDVLNQLMNSGGAINEQLNPGEQNNYNNFIPSDLLPTPKEKCVGGRGECSSTEDNMS